jgi:murein DD-endopeptidase MepM/ murein hydrolase activator NlpD
MPRHYIRGTRPKCYADEMKPALLWGQPPSAVRRSKAPQRLRCSLISLTLLCMLTLPALAASWTVQAQPAKLVNGAPVLFKVTSPTKLDSLTGTWLGHQLTFNYNVSAKNWFALAGVSFDTTPGKYTLELSGENTAKSSVSFKRSFTVGRAQYPKIRLQLSVEKKFTEPDPEQVKQIADANKIKEERFSHTTPEREWDGKFLPPVEAETSDVYGSQRIFNGIAQRPHYGLDYRVHTGTPVKAMNDGFVLLARFLYYEGNFVVIDHGQGLYTLYLHLSELKVKEGDTVKRGQEVGLSGGTGRATGPHLDVRVRWQGIYLDPARLLQMSLP